MAKPVTFEFETLPYTPGDGLLEDAPRRPAVFRIFDVNGTLILLEKTHNLAERLARFYAGERPPHALDLGGLTGRIEFCPTNSPLEALYLLHIERKRWFPADYRAMRTFARYPLLKINCRQRFPRLYAARRIKPGIDYFGPFASRNELEGLKATLERIFGIRPCRYDIRGDDPYPDCIYFQMHTCSRPCNGDIGREAYLEDIAGAVAFIQGMEGDLVESSIRRIQELAAATRFEEAERVRRRLARIERGRRDHPRTYYDLRSFDFVAVMDASAPEKCKAAFVRAGLILGFEEHEVRSLKETIESSLRRAVRTEVGDADAEDRYEHFCIVSSFLMRPVQGVRLFRLGEPGETAAAIVLDIQARCQRRSKKRASHPDG